MKAALLVDWENLQACLKQVRYASSPQVLAKRLLTIAYEWANALHGKLEFSEVFASERGFGNTADFWMSTGYKVHLAVPDRGACSQELEGRVSELLLEYKEKCSYFIIAAGDYDYTSLVKNFETNDCRYDFWLVNPAKFLSQDHPHFHSIPKFLHLPHSDISDNSPLEPQSIDEIFEAAIEGNSGGVFQVFEDVIIRRTEMQLKAEARKYSTSTTVNSVFSALIANIQASHFAPDVIISWIDQAKHWRGSETVAKELKKTLHCSIEIVNIREEGERREVTSIPDLSPVAV